nr:gamma-aminobutyric acid type B receptor subunit 2-like [Lytechinus pictus]
MKMAYASSSITLSDRGLFPYFFRTIASATEINLVQLAIMQQYGWTKVAIIYETNALHAGVSSNLQAICEQRNLSVLASESFTHDPSDAIQRLKQKDVRIIVGNFYENTARKVFCEAYKHDLYGASYVWFLVGYYTPDWQHRVDPNEVDCSPHQILLASEGYLTATWSMNGRKEKPTITGRTPQQFRDDMAAILGHVIDLNGQDVAANAHDAMWAIALGLNASIPEIAPRTLEQYTYGDEGMVDIFKAKIEQTEFDGVSGPVSFSPVGDRIGVFLVEQNRDGSERVIGTAQRGKSITWIYPRTDIWIKNDGEPPSDHDKTRIIRIYQGVPRLEVIVVGTLATAGVVLAISFLVFNVAYRNIRVIKMSSPRMNNLIVIGIIIAYLSAVLFGLDYDGMSDVTRKYICTARLWTITIAFTLAFGGMFTKMWRVYTIIVYKKTQRKVIKDVQLFAIILVFFIIDLIILILREIIDSYYIIEESTRKSQTAEDIRNDVVFVDFHKACVSTRETVWLTMLMVIKLFVMIFGAFLAWQTRNINVPALNDSYHVGLSIYNVAICCAVAVPLSIFKVGNLAVAYGLVASFMLLCATTSLCLLFFPKALAVRRGANNVGPDNRIKTISSAVENSGSRNQERATDRLKAKEPVRITSSAHSSAMGNEGRSNRMF